jgi:hypothetical protein
VPPSADLALIVIESIVQIAEQLDRARSKVEIDMRKRQISTPPSVRTSGESWLDVDGAASVEVTSEENGYPIESALLGLEGAGVRRMPGLRPYAVELSGVTALELIIVPDKIGGAARASLASFRVA